MLQSPVSPHISPPGGWSFTQAETGVKFHSLSLQAIKSDILRHRKAMSLPFDDNHILHELCQQNPQVRCEPNPRANGYLSPLQIAGRAAWAELHGFAESVNDSNFNPEAIGNWVSLWQNRIPNYEGCKCLQHWLVVIRELPLDSSSPEAFRKWCVEAHNKINQKIGHAQWP